MRYMKFAVVTGSLLAIPAALLAQAGGDPAANWQRVANCAKADTAAGRHACIDQILRDTGLLNSQHELADAREQFGSTRRTGEVKAEVAKARPVPVPSAPPSISELETTLADVAQTSTRKLLFTTPEGATWRQTDDKVIRRLPKVGASLTIETTAMGGFRCKIGQFTVFRCMRVN